jgi:hypothetical protein
VPTTISSRRVSTFLPGGELRGGRSRADPRDAQRPSLLARLERGHVPPAPAIPAKGGTGGCCWPSKGFRARPPKHPVAPSTPPPGSPQSCRLPFLHSSQIDSDDLLALPARCPMSLVVAASSRRMFCRWASPFIAAKDASRHRDASVPQRGAPQWRSRSGAPAAEVATSGIAGKLRPSGSCSLRPLRSRTSRSRGGSGCRLPRRPQNSPE